MRVLETLISALLIKWSVNVRDLNFRYFGYASDILDTKSHNGTEEYLLMRLEIRQ